MLVSNVTASALIDGCMLGSIAHAIMVAHMPELAFEQSWDGDSYSVQDGCGTRGTIVFANARCVGAFRREPCERPNQVDAASEFLRITSRDMLGIAMRHVYPYLLDDVSGRAKPV